MPCHEIEAVTEIGGGIVNFEADADLIFLGGTDLTFEVHDIGGWHTAIDTVFLPPRDFRNDYGPVVAVDEWRLLSQPAQLVFAEGIWCVPQDGDVD